MVDESLESGTGQEATPEKPKHLSVDDLVFHTHFDDYGLAESNILWLFFITRDRKPEVAQILDREFSCLEGRTLIDFGAGNLGASFMPRMAAQLGCQKYIAVDRYRDNSRDLQMKINEDEEEELPKETEAIRKDGLKFLSEQPDNSASVMINRLDSNIIQGAGSEINRQYLDRLAKEIARVIGKDNICFGYDSSPVFDAMEGSDLFDRKVIGPDIEIYHFKSQQKE